jgi:hypothetical protein
MVNELRAVVAELGGRRALGRSFTSDRDMREAIRDGFPPKVVEELMIASGLTLKELAASLDLSPRSPAAAAENLHSMNRTGSTGLPVWWPLPANILATQNAPGAGLSVPIAPSGESLPYRPSIQK